MHSCRAWPDALPAGLDKYPGDWLWVLMNARASGNAYDAYRPRVEALVPFQFRSLF